jgi:hypothetical protein
MSIKTLLLAAGIAASAIPTAAPSAEPGRYGTRAEALVAAARERSERLDVPADRSHQWLSFAAQLLARMAAVRDAADPTELRDLAAAYETAMQEALTEAQAAGSDREDAMKLVRSFTERHQRALETLLEQVAPGAKPALRRAQGSVRRQQVLALRAVGPTGDKIQGTSGSRPSPGNVEATAAAPRKGTAAAAAGKGTAAAAGAPAATGAEAPATLPVPAAPATSVIAPVAGVSPLVVGVPVFSPGVVVPAPGAAGVNDDGAPPTETPVAPGGTNPRPGVRPTPGGPDGTPGAVVPRPVVRPPGVGPPVAAPPVVTPPVATPPSVRSPLVQPPAVTTPPGGAGVPAGPTLRR